MEIGRQNRVKKWLEDISTDIETTCGIFENNLISIEDIGIDEYHDIICDLNNVLQVIDNVIFKIENIIEQEEEEL